VSKKTLVTVQVKGQDPTSAVPALFSNFVGISRVGTEVQFEFIFLDLNQVAELIKSSNTTENSTLPPVIGKSVAKIVMPAAAFVQAKDHLAGIFKDIETELKKLEGIPDARNRASS